MAFNVRECVLWKIIIFIIIWKEVYMLPNTAVDNVSVKDISFCEEGWKPYDQYCYKLFKRILTWRDASKKCKRLGGHLASIHSKEQNDFMTNFDSGSYGLFWIGLHDYDLNRIYVWHDETDVNYTNWNRDEPDGGYRAGDCVELYVTKRGYYQFGKWLTFTCGHALPYMCQKKFATSTNTSSSIVNETIATSTITNSNIDSETIYMLPNTVADNVSVNDIASCEEGWKPYDQYCFKFFDIALNWTHASNACRRIDGHLASIHSKEQNDFMENFHIGGHEESVWIGLHDHDLDGIFEWDDASDVTYTNWNTDEPLEDYTSGDCVELHLEKSGFFQFGKWYITECEGYYPYLCQKKFTTRSTETDMAGTNGFISVTAFAITLIIGIVFLASMGGIIYHKRHWLEEKRVKIFYRRAEGPVSIEPYRKLSLKPKLTII